MTLTWSVQGNYGTNGWEDLTTFESREDAIAERDNYDANEPQYRHRVRRDGPWTDRHGREV